MRRYLTLRKLWPLIPIVLFLLYLLIDNFLGGWLDCRIDHFTGFHLLTPREAVRGACRAKLNPFSI